MEDPLPSKSATHTSEVSSDLKLKVLLETMPDLVWLKDCQGKYLECNSAFLKFFGMEREAVLGKTDFDIVEKPLAEFFRNKDREALEANKPRMNEETVYNAVLGKPSVLETIKTPMHDMKGEVVGVLGVARDITERKELETLLQHRLDAFIAPPKQDEPTVSLADLFDLSHLQSLQDNFADAFNVASLITDLDGMPITKPSNFCEFCRDVIRQTELGLKNCMLSDSVIGRYNSDGPNLQPCMSGGLWDAGVPIIVGTHHVANWLVGQVRDSRQSEEDIISYAKMIGADPEKAVNAFRKVPVMKKEQFQKVAKVLHMFALQIANSAYQNLLQARHISDRKGFEDEVVKVNQELQKATHALENSNKDLLVAARKAEESDRLKSAFLANMSHEIRTPLNAILGFASLLDDPDISSQDTAHFVGVITRSGESLLDLINNIIDISKIDAGLTTLETDLVDLTSLLQTVYTIHNSKIQNLGRGNLNLQLSLPAAPLKVVCDEVRLRQVLDNLLNNATKFTLEGQIDFGCEVKGDTLHFWVKDTGIGISSDQYDAIFERFQQASHETERLFGGTGLGLSIAKSCVELMEGRIWVESKMGEGSAFYFDIPYVSLEEEPQETGQTEPAKHAFQGEHILIAEDDDLNYEYLETVLKHQNLKISHATNGMDTVKMYHSEKDIGLILMDIRMPEIDGLEATRRIRETDSQVPIIAQTAYAFASDREACMKAGCNDFITKPMKRSDLLEILHRYLDRG